MTKTICRTCLAANKRMHDLKNTRLQELFEKLTSKKLSEDNGWSGVCNICYSQLQKCGRFLDMAQKADKMYKQLLTKSTSVECITKLRPTNNFIVTPVSYMSLPDHLLPLDTVTVKIEPTEVKQEEESNGCGLFETVKIQDSPSTDELMISVCDQGFIPPKEPYTCRTCNKTFQSAANLKRHLTFSHKKLAYTCKICNKDFSQLAALITHSKTHRKVKCDVCDKTFTVKSTFQSHLRKHTKPYACQLCDKSFSERSSLKKHMTTHSTEKPYICDCCNKSFAHRTFLISHLRSHAGEKPYTCELCGKTFAQSGHKISHKRSHEKIKPFPCTVCGKPFAERTSVKRHIMRIHSPLNPYACEICHRTFPSPDTVKIHMKSHKNKKSLDENISVEYIGFPTKGDMQKHMENLH